MNTAQKLLDGENITYGQFFKYTHRDERASVARQSATFVYEVLTPYVVSKISDNVDHYKTESTNLSLEVFRFTDEALKPKEEWLSENKDENIIRVERNKVEQWMLSLKGTQAKDRR